MDYSALTQLKSKPKYAQDQTQLVAVKFPNSDKTYTYAGGGNLRKGQKIDTAPVTNKFSGKNSLAPVEVVKTAAVVGAKVGDHTGINEAGQVIGIPKPLKALPGNMEQKRGGDITVGGEKINVGNYMSDFNSRKQSGRYETFRTLRGMSYETR